MRNWLAVGSNARRTLLRELVKRLSRLKCSVVNWLNLLPTSSSVIQKHPLCVGCLPLWHKTLCNFKRMANLMIPLLNRRDYSAEYLSANYVNTTQIDSFVSKNTIINFGSVLNIQNSKTDRETFGMETEITEREREKETIIIL